MAGTTGLEPATSDVTGRRSNQLNYVPAMSRYINASMAGDASAKCLPQNFRASCYRVKDADSFRDPSLLLAGAAGRLLPFQTHPR